MKRIIYLLVGLLVVGGLGYMAYKLSAGSGKSDEKIAALNFDIQDTASINRIEITEPSGEKIELVKDGFKWTDKDGGCVQQLPIFNIMEAVVNVRFKGYVPEATTKTIVNRMATTATEVKFYQNGEWTKTWYIGSATPDHYGTYMLVESAEAGKSDLPVIMEIKGLRGIISPRFFASHKRWACSEIFALNINEIASVDVVHTGHPERNFTVNKTGRRFHVTNNGRAFAKLDTNMVVQYLQNYRKIHFEYVNSDLNPKQVDSVKQSTPFCLLTLKTTKNKVTKLKMYRRQADNGVENVNMYGETADYDVNRFWCLLPNGELVKCQYFVFNPLIMGHVYFSYPTNP